MRTSFEAQVKNAKNMKGVVMNLVAFVLFVEASNSVGGIEFFSK